MYNLYIIFSTIYFNSPFILFITKPCIMLGNTILVFYVMGLFIDICFMILHYHVKFYFNLPASLH